MGAHDLRSYNWARMPTFRPKFQFLLHECHRGDALRIMRPYLDALDAHNNGISGQMKKTIIFVATVNDAV
jgi:hypothetical protein